MKAAATFLTGLLLGFGSFAVLTHEETVADEVGAAALFGDIETGSYYDDSVLEMVHKGIIRGYDDGRFGPHDFVTRAQATVMLKRYHHNVIRPLQRKVDFLLDHFNFGKCGDGQKDLNEQCDDGNLNDGDGCSAECLLELRPEPKPYYCEGGYKEGDTFPADDGCNTCRCTKEGIACTEKACFDPPVACPLDAKQCPDGSFVSRSGPDCTFAPCPPSGASCGEREQDLADKIRASRACRTNDDCSVLVRSCGPFVTCGKPVNSASVGAVKLAIAEFAKMCPEDRQVCVDCEQRNAVCEAGFCRLDPEIACTEDARVCPDGSSVSRNPDLDCDFDPCPEEVSCDDRKKDLDAAFEESRDCSADSDCSVYVNGCSPYLTCGKAISAAEADSLAQAVEDYVIACPEDPAVCALCIEGEAVCSGGKCTLKE